MYRAAEALVVAGHAYVDEQSAEEMRASRGDFATPGRDSPYRVAHAGREPRAPAPDEERRARRRRGGAARQDRHGEPEHQPARPGALPHQAGDPPQHRRHVVHLPDVHLRASDRGRARERHPLDLHARVRGPAAVLRLAARHALRARPARAAAAAPVRVRAPQRQLRRHEQAQAQAARRREDRRRLGRPAHADDRRAAPARLHAGVDPPPLRARRHQQGGRLDRLREPRDRACATTSTRRRRARWRCSTRSAWRSPTGPRPSATPRTASPAMRRSIRSIRSSARATCASAPSSGSSATTSPRCRRRASSASTPATASASSTATSSNAPAARRTRAGTVTRVLATIVADTKSGTPGADAVKVKGTLTWLAADDALAAEVRLYDRLFVDPHPDAGGKDFKASLNPASKQVVPGFVERSLGAAPRRRSLPVRAPRLLRRRPRRPRHGPAGLQPHRDAARHLVALGRGFALTSAARSFQSPVRRGWKRTPCCSRRIVPGPESRHEPSSSFPPPPDACAPLRRRHVPPRVAPRRTSAAATLALPSLAHAQAAAPAGAELTYKSVREGTGTEPDGDRFGARPLPRHAD